MAAVAEMAVANLDELVPDSARKALAYLRPEVRAKYFAVALAMEAGRFKNDEISEYVETNFGLQLKPTDIRRIRRSPGFVQLVHEATARALADARLMVAVLIKRAVYDLLVKYEQDDSVLSSKDVLQLAKLVASGGAPSVKLTEFVADVSDGRQVKVRSAETTVDALMAKNADG